MNMVLRCDCGFKVAGETESDLVAAAQAHAKDAHGADVAAEVVIDLLRARGPGAAGHEDGTIP